MDREERERLRQSCEFQPLVPTDTAIVLRLLDALDAAEGRILDLTQQHRGCHAERDELAAKLDACEREREGIRSAAGKLANQLVEVREDARALAQFVRAFEARWDGMPSAFHEDAVKLLARPGVRRLLGEKETP